MRINTFSNYILRSDFFPLLIFHIQPTELQYCIIILFEYCTLWIFFLRNEPYSCYHFCYGLVLTNLCTLTCTELDRWVCAVQVAGIYFFLLLLYISVFASSVSTRPHIINYVFWLAFICCTCITLRYITSVALVLHYITSVAFVSVWNFSVNNTWFVAYLLSHWRIFLPYSWNLLLHASVEFIWCLLRFF